MDVLSVASEAMPLVKTGGLADVAGALPDALRAEGVEMRVLLPAYRGLAAELHGTEEGSVSLTGGRSAAVIAGTVGETRFYLLDAPGYFDRPGNPYTAADGSDWPDNHLRFGLLAEVGAAIARQGVGGWIPDVVHAHDWQAGLVPAYLALGGAPQPPVLMTIHNMAYQGLFAPDTLGALHLPQTMMVPEALEFWGFLGFLKGGLALADRISTVSPGYAAELMTPEYGIGLDGVLRYRASDLVGILNGIDTVAWDPAADPDLAATYTAKASAKKAANREAVAAQFGLEVTDDAPLYVVISRMTGQKGLDLLLETLPVLLETGACLAVLGSGDPALEARFTQAAAAHPRRIAAQIGYAEPLAHLMQGGGDAILIPSRFEPCGLTQLYGLRYGTLPVVARTGGLADTVIDANEAAIRAGVATGVVHAPGSAEALAGALRRTAALFGARKIWAQMRGNAMRQPVGWDLSAARYAALYRDMVRA